MAINTKAYDDLYKNYKKSVDQNTSAQINKAQQAADSQLKQAYVTRVQDERKLNDQMTNAGIRGGATETSNLKLATNYGNTRNSINGTLQSSINDINLAANQNLLAYKQDIDAKKQAYIENREAEARQNAREDAIRKEQYKREDAANAYNRKVQAEQSAFDRRMQQEQLAMSKNQTQYERQQTQRSQRIEEYTATFGKYYDVDQLKKLLTNPNYKNNPLAVQVINARIAYLRSPEYKQAKKAAK